jgi:hypothetical protein
MFYSQQNENKFMNNIDYVIISSDDNPLYKDFYGIVAKRWFELGFKTYFINITDNDEIVKNEWGVIHKIKSIDGFSTGFQSQIVRLFSPNLIDGNILISDIDMLPISSRYFNEQVSYLTNDNIVLCSGQPYSDVPFYPMCYVISNSKVLKKTLGIDNLSFEEYCKMIKEQYHLAWNSDENFLYDKLKNFQGILTKKERDFKKRIDRSSWMYDINLIKNDYYIDSHLLRPLSTEIEKINKLLNDLN